jgi:hypothetical protein
VNGLASPSHSVDDRYDKSLVSAWKSSGYWKPSPNSQEKGPEKLLVAEQATADTKKENKRKTPIFSKQDSLRWASGGWKDFGRRWPYDPKQEEIPIRVSFNLLQSS